MDVYKFHKLFYSKTDKQWQDTFLLSHMKVSTVERRRVDESNAIYSPSKCSTKYYVRNQNKELVQGNESRDESSDSSEEDESESESEQEEVDDTTYLEAGDIAPEVSEFYAVEFKTKEDNKVKIYVGQVKRVNKESFSMQFLRRRPANSVAFPPIDDIATVKLQNIVKKNERNVRQTRITEVFRMYQRVFIIF